MLEERKTVYDNLKDRKEKLYSYKYKTERQYKQEYPFLKEVDSKALQIETRNLIRAFQNFFRGLRNGQKIGYPKFKSKKNKQTYTTYNIDNNIRIDIETNRIRIPKVGWVKYRDNRESTHSIKYMTVSKVRTNKYYVSMLTELEINVIPKKEIQIDKIEAFDMSAPHFLVSERKINYNPRFYRLGERRLKRLHRQLARKQKGSKNREKARLRLAKFYERMQNRKNDWTHKVTHQLSQEYDALILEDLNIKGMLQFNSGLSKSVSLDFSWYQFVSYLRYKMKWRGKHLILIDRFFPSSKLCSVCGQRNNDLKLSDRTWICECGAMHDRDINASSNLKKRGLDILQDREIQIILNGYDTTAGTAGSHASGDRISLHSKETV